MHCGVEIAVNIVKTATHPDSRKAFFLTTNHHSATPPPNSTAVSPFILALTKPFDNAALLTFQGPSQPPRPRVRPHAGPRPRYIIPSGHPIANSNPPTNFPRSSVGQRRAWKVGLPVTLGTMRKHFIQHTRRPHSFNSSLFILPSAVTSHLRTTSLRGVAMTSCRKSREGNMAGQRCTYLDNS